MNTSTRKIAVAGMLGAMAVVLAASPIGIIRVPPVAATTMHIPAILGGLLEGPAVGAGVGLIFGIYSFLTSGPWFADPLVSILPRLLIGPSAYVVFRFTRSPLWAAVVGTLVNTCGVLVMLTLRGYLTAPVTAGMAVTHGIPEIILAVVLVALLWRKVGPLYLAREESD